MESSPSLTSSSITELQKRKQSGYLHKNIQVDQLNQIEDLAINPHTYEHLIFDEEAKMIQWDKESIFNKWCWNNWMSKCRRMKIDPHLST